MNSKNYEKSWEKQLWGRFNIDGCLFTSCVFHILQQLGADGESVR